MARSASPLTVAVRQLLDQSNGAITHAQARPMLAKLGHSIATEPPERSENLAAWEAAASKRTAPDPENQAAVKAYNAAIGKACGFNPRQISAVLRELQTRAAFAKERNYFDVTKANWGKHGTPVSQAPRRGPGRPRKNALPVQAAAPRRGPGRPRKNALPVQVATPRRGPGRPAKTPVVGNVDSVISTIEGLGGLTAAQRRLSEIQGEIETLNAESAALTQTIADFEALRKRVAA